MTVNVEIAAQRPETPPAQTDAGPHERETDAKHQRAVGKRRRRHSQRKEGEQATGCHARAQDHETVAIGLRRVGAATERLAHFDEQPHQDGDGEHRAGDRLPGESRSHWLASIPQSCAMPAWIITARRPSALHVGLETAPIHSYRGRRRRSPAENWLTARQRLSRGRRKLSMNSQNSKMPTELRRNGTQYCLPG
jgi:hypothetical protein